MQHGCAPVGRHDKSGLCTMDEPSILRRRGLQVGKQIEPSLRVGLCLLGLFFPLNLRAVCEASALIVLLAEHS